MNESTNEIYQSSVKEYLALEKLTGDIIYTGEKLNHFLSYQLNATATELKRTISFNNFGS